MGSKPHISKLYFERLCIYKQAIKKATHHNKIMTLTWYLLCSICSRDIVMVPEMYPAHFIWHLHFYYKDLTVILYQKNVSLINCKTFDWKPMTTRNGLLPVSDSKQILYKTQLLFWRWFIKYQLSCHFDFTSLICTVILHFIWHLHFYYKDLTVILYQKNVSLINCLIEILLVLYMHSRSKYSFEM
jgi:hypothetical protein